MKNIINISTNAPDNIKKSDANKQLMKLHKKLYSLQNIFYAAGQTNGRKLTFGRVPIVS